MAKKLRLLPSLKEKRHYLVIKSLKPIKEKEFKEKIEKIILNFLGIFGYSKAGPLFIELKKEYALVSVITKYVDEVKAALALSNVKCVGVSGTIKKARRFI
jgi:RNase P/RNase MRP subunit POP5